MMRGDRFRLYPTPAQAETLGQWIGTTRFVYNLALEQRSTWGRSHGIGWAAQSREVTALRDEVDWLADVPRVCLEQAIRDLDKAYTNFFAGRAKYPTRRRKGLHDRIRFSAKDLVVTRLNAKWGAVRVPKIGPIKFRLTRDIGELVNMTVSRSADGWMASMTSDAQVISTLGDGAVGVDRGVAHTLALSSGELLSAPRCRTMERRAKAAQRALSRKVRGSIRAKKAKRRLGRITATIARRRNDWLQRTTTAIVRRFNCVAIEDLKISAMTAAATGAGRASKAGLNRSILAQGWGEFARMLAYKLDACGGVLVKVNPAYTSQTCAECGVIDKMSRESQARFVCVACGHVDNADVNAARNILRQSLAVVEGGSYAPDEARTRKAA